jgi:hypothetical protein
MQWIDESLGSGPFLPATAHVSGKWEEIPRSHENPCASYLRYRPDTREVSYSERCPGVCGGCSSYYGVNVKYWDVFIGTNSRHELSTAPNYSHSVEMLAAASGFIPGRD